MDSWRVGAVTTVAVSLVVACFVNLNPALRARLSVGFAVIPQHPTGITGRLVSVSAEVAHSVRERHRLPTAQAADDQTLYDVVVVGGGAAGLAAAWRIADAGPPSLRCLVLELEEQPGGNSRGGSDSATGLSFPWGAHYLPVPSPTGTTAEVAQLIETVLRTSRKPPPDECDDQPWCRSQLFMPETQRWEDPPERGGMIPTTALDTAGWRQYHRFMAKVDEYVDAVGTDGRPAFAVPVDASSTDLSFRALDNISMSEWMDANGFTSPPLRWFVDYGCRDDYGTTLETTSAWVAFHYFCSRETENSLVWEDGLGSVISGMIDHLQTGNLRTGSDDSTSRQQRPMVAIQTSSLVHRITTHSSPHGQATVEFADLRINVSRTVQARRVIFAAPHHSARHIIAGYALKERKDAMECGTEGCLNFTYAPWVVANVFLREPPPRPWAWENMVYRPPAPVNENPHRDHNTSNDLGALGYVLAPSQIRQWSTWQAQSWPINLLAPFQWLISPLQAQKLSTAVTRTPFSATLTAFFMQPLSSSDDNGRRSASLAGALHSSSSAKDLPSAAFPNAWLQKTWQAWRDDVLSSLRLSIPTIDEHAYRIDIRVLAHAMNRPVPGFLWGRRSPRQAARKPYAGVVWFAHSDNSGLSLFEEAVTQGFRAADEVLASFHRSSGEH